MSTEQALGAYLPLRLPVGRCVVALLVACAFVAGGLLLPAGAWAQDGEEDAEDERLICIQCHADVSPDLVDTWQSQAHGRNQVGCSSCHNTHEEAFQPQPDARTCFGCHSVSEIHPDFTEETPGARCMDCHTANVHRYPSEASWFLGGLEPERLEEAPGPESSITAAAGRYAGIAVVVLAAVFGLIIGFVLDRFVRNL